MSSHPRQRVESTPSETTTEVLALKLKALRSAAGLTLQQLGQRCGMAASTLSKIENGQLSPTYEKIVALAHGLSVDVGELFRPVQAFTPQTRLSVTRAGQGVVHDTEQYVYRLLHADLAKKRFIPLLTTIKAHETVSTASLARHDGEEMVYVLQGSVQIHTEGYEPLTLQVGDSCYFDSSMGHALISSEGAPAQVLWISSHITFGAGAA